METKIPEVFVFGYLLNKTEYWFPDVNILFFNKEGGGVQWIINERLSIISTPRSYGGQEGLLEVLLLGEEDEPEGYTTAGEAIAGVHAFLRGRDWREAIHTEKADPYYV